MSSSASRAQVVSVIGCGYLGAVHAVAMAELGHTVIGIESDQARSSALAAGAAPFFEPGLDAMLARHVAAGRLRFSTDIADAAPAQLHFLCVGTPQAVDSQAADLTHVDAAIGDLLPVLRPGDLVVGKSTVPVGTAYRIAGQIAAAQPGASLVWNPEFLREGFAIKDTLTPDRFVFGVGPGQAGADAAAALSSVYGPVVESTPVVVTDYATSELVKAAANAFLATKISFINAMSDLCDVAGGDITQLADAIGHDTRIGRRFLNAGLGFGGGCLPKDIRAFMHRAGELGASDAIAFLREVDGINLRRRERAVKVVAEWLGDGLRGRRVAVLGASFKPESDDIRDSPALAVAEALHLQGADVMITDPRALDNVRRKSPQLHYGATVEETVAGAEAVLVLTEWQAYADLDPHLIGDLVSSRRLFDGRNAVDPAKWRSAGWEYKCFGRPHAGS